MKQVSFPRKYRIDNPPSASQRLKQRSALDYIKLTASCCIPLTIPTRLETKKTSSAIAAEVSILADTSFCASSSTLVETMTSTPNFAPGSERRCRSLSQLSTHILSAITAYLDVVSRICLQNVNRHLVKAIDVNLTCRFRKSNDSQYGLPATCVLCKTW